MKTPHFRTLTRRHVLASVNAAVLMFALVLMQFPTVAIAQDAPPPTSPVEVVDVAVTPEVETSSEPPPSDDKKVPEGLTDETPTPTDTDEAVEPPVVVEEETPVETTEEEAPAEARMMMFAAPPTSPSNEGGQCVIYSDATTLEDGSASFELPGPYHSSWTAVVDALSKWIWGDSPIVDPVGDTTQTFTKTFSVANDAVGGTLIIAADNSYSVELDGVEISNPTDANVEDNYHNNKVDTIAINASALEAGTHTLTFTVKNWAMAGGTAASNPAGLKYKLTIDGSNCGEPQVETATIVAHKIVCPVESELPNWGAGAADITENTAEDFLDAHPTCHLERDWQFQWADAEDISSTPGTVYGEASTPPWTTFGPTDGDGMISVEIPVTEKVWVREVLKDGYVPFSGENTTEDVSAELYCSTDVLNYDNFEWILPKEGGTYHCVAFNAPKTSNVTMCKVNTEEEPLSGWQLTLKGDTVGSVEVDPDGDAHTIANVGAGSYIATANGQYIYRPGDVSASTSDAAFSLRAIGDSVYGGPYAPWVEVNTFPMPHTGWLGIMLNGQVTDWGSTFNPNHEYVHATTTGALSDFVFRILDDVYSDNSGSLSVDLNHGYTGVTDEDGCVTFENVPYGTYEAGEILKDGWTNVSGTGKVDVDEPEEIFTIVNTDGELPPENSARIIATKVVCNSEADLPNNSMGKPITAATAQAWVEQSDGACHLESGWEFEWGNQNAGDGGPATIGHAPNYTTFGTTDVNGVASTYVPLDGITTIQMREVLKEGFIPFTNAGDVSAEFYCANDAAGYDNWEWISNPVAGETYHCVAFNAAVDDGEEPTTSSETVTVSPNAMQGWEFNSDRLTWAMGIGDFVTGPDTAPLSDGSARLTTPTNDERTKLRKYLPAGTQISDITELKYSTYRKDPNGGALTLALQFDVNFGAVPIDPTKADARIVYEPYHTQQALILDDTWQQWDAMNDAAGTGTGSWWIAGPNPSVCPQANPCTWTELNAAYPDLQVSAKSLENTIDTQGAMLFKAGGSWAGFEGMVDKFVFGLTTGLNTHTTTYDFEPAAPSIIETNDSNGGGGGGSNKKAAARQGEVLGASTAACSALLSTFMKMGASNDVTEVVELQGFLNEHMGAMLPLTGVFGPMTDAAVHTFQKKYWEDVLKPWFAYPEAGIADMDDSTGYVYKTTQWKINDIVCPDVAPFPALP